MKLSKGIQFFAGSTRTTYDLTNLNLAAGAYSITVKAKAEGYTDSDASNAVNYTAAAPIPTDSILFEGETSDFTLKATNKSWNGTVEYSTDKNTWNTWDGSEITSANKKLYLRGKNNTTFYSKKGAQFVLSANAGCYGNINALLDYENPPTALATSCYRSMFQGCTSLTIAPALPATTLADRCYRSMFSDCTGLKISATQTGEYTTAWRIPSTGEIAAEATDWNTYMLNGTGGTFKGDPSINTTYYIAG